jgi:hypothetical protein
MKRNQTLITLFILAVAGMSLCTQTVELNPTLPKEIITSSSIRTLKLGAVFQCGAEEKDSQMFEVSSTKPVTDLTKLSLTYESSSFVNYDILHQDNDHTHRFYV